MEIYLSLASVLGALLLGAMSPGPSFVLVARTSIANSRSDGLFMAIGMGVGGAVFAVLVMTGLHAVLASVPSLYFILKWFGGLYLLYLALQIWRGAKQSIVISDMEEPSPNTAIKSFLLALITQVSNPKAMVVYGSIFAALLPRDLPLPIALMLPFLVFLVESGWYAIVALALSSKSSTSIYLNMKSTIDRSASFIMGALGLKLLSEAKQILDR